MDKPSPGRLLTDWLLQLDEARNARPRSVQQPSEMVRQRDARLAEQAEKIAALRRARETSGTSHSNPSTAELMARKRELIDTGTDKRYVRHNKRGTSFVESDDGGRSLAADRRRRAKRKVKSGEGDKGDRPHRKTARKAAKKSATRRTAGRKSTAKGRAKRR